jgi:hypothetical protein
VKLRAAEVNRALLTSVRPHLHSVANDVQNDAMPLRDLEALLRREEQRFNAFRGPDRSQGKQQQRDGGKLKG